MRLDQEPRWEGTLLRKLRAFFAFAPTLFDELRTIMWRLPSEPLELLLSVEAIGFGLVLATSPQVFASSPGFAAMAAIAPQYTWAIFAGLLGIFLLCGLMFRRATIRRWCLLGMWMFWLFVAVQIYVISMSTGVSTYGGLAVASAIAYLRLDMRSA